MCIRDRTNVDWIEDCNISCGDDKDGDGVPDALDLDADNDGITNVVECITDLISTAPIPGDLEPGDPSVALTQTTAGMALGYTITIDAPVATAGSPVNFNVSGQAGTGIRMEDNNGYTLGDAYSTTIGFSIPAVPMIAASNTLGNSNINQSDSFTSVSYTHLTLPTKA